MPADGPTTAPTAGARRDPAGRKAPSDSRALAPPISSRGGPLTTDRPTAENPGEKFSSHVTPDLRQKQDRRTDAINVYGVAYFVVGTRGRCRLVLIVCQCPWCGRPHVHNAPQDFLAGKRLASCRGGRYVVHVGAVEGAVAA